VGRAGVPPRRAVSCGCEARSGLGVLGNPEQMRSKYEDESGWVTARVWRRRHSGAA
jgi:hypothetical protein